jgi:hypothetical protein
MLACAGLGIATCLAMTGVLEAASSAPFATGGVAGAIGGGFQLGAQLSGIGVATGLVSLWFLWTGTWGEG